MVRFNALLLLFYYFPFPFCRARRAGSSLRAQACSRSFADTPPPISFTPQPAGRPFPSFSLYFTPRTCGEPAIIFPRPPYSRRSNYSSRRSAAAGADRGSSCFVRPSFRRPVGGFSGRRRNAPPGLCSSKGRCSVLSDLQAPPRNLTTEIDELEATAGGGLAGEDERDPSPGRPLCLPSVERRPENPRRRRPRCRKSPEIPGIFLLPLPPPFLSAAHRLQSVAIRPTEKQDAPLDAARRPRKHFQAFTWLIAQSKK